jgi:hypothetical protein
MAGVYRNRIYWELLSNPPMVLKTMANTSCANTPKKCFQQIHFRAPKAPSQRFHDKLANRGKSRKLTFQAGLSGSNFAKRFRSLPPQKTGATWPRVDNPDTRFLRKTMTSS